MMFRLFPLLLVASLYGCGAAVDGLATAVLPDGEQKPDASDTANPIADKDSGMTWEHAEFGRTSDGEKIEQYTLQNRNGIVVRLINYGATVVSVETKDRDGKSENIVLGHADVDHWLKNPCYFGCTVGRYGNRIGNAVFGLNGNIYNLPKNDGKNHLHGGTGGFHTRIWEAEATSDDSSVTVTFHRVSPDGEDGYPGNLDVTVQYTLNDDNELKIHYEATTDKPTVVNLTNHCYWNLTGNAAEKDVLGHELRLLCNHYLPVNDQLIPTGDTLAVAETPMNFTQGKLIGHDLPGVEGGYDHCFVIARSVDGLAPVARVYDPSTGRVLEISTTEPGIQFYSGNFLNGEKDCGGFGKHHGFCLETQHYPDSPNQPHFPSTELKPGEKYQSTTVHKFSVYN
ncbi:MAG: aldose epimerase family protein [Planctomycetaceae bacterium]